MAISTEDRMAIMDLLSRYNHAIDGGDSEAWLDCFTEDAVYEFPPDRRWEGIEQLREVAASRANDPDRAVSRHWLNNVLIEGDAGGDAGVAQVTCYLMLLRPHEDARIHHTGMYRHTVRKVDGAWKFAHRRMDQDR